MSAILRRCSTPILLLGALFGTNAAAAVADPRMYNMGTPVLTDLWVDPVNGLDTNTGLARNGALKTLSKALTLVPSGPALTATGWRLNLLPGVYPAMYLGSRQGTYQFPVILQAADGPGTVTMAGRQSIDGSSYVYLIGLTISPPASTVLYHALHITGSNHILVRDVTVVGQGSLATRTAPKEGLKSSQSQYVYVENSDISNAWDNALDFVAVQYGHIFGNRIHGASSWAAYVKGGSAYLRIEGNEFYDSPVGGFTVGGSTGLEFMVSPWLHYEAYHVQFVNNVIHDTGGAGVTVSGAYNALVAYNSLYRVSTAAAPIRVGFGERTCDYDAAACEAYRQMGAWGTASLTAGHWIPNKNVFIYNNLVYNPAGYAPGNRQFQVFGPVIPDSTSNIPSPAVTDDNLQIRGNVIWNGTSSTPLGIELTGYGCQPGNPTCNATQLRAENTINTQQPDVVWQSTGDLLAPPYGSWLGTAMAFAIPDFLGGDLPTTPFVLQGSLQNLVPYDRILALRTMEAPPGAYIGADGTPTPTLAVDLGTLNMSYVTGQPMPAARTVQVTSSAPALSIQAVSGAAWLSVSPGSGSTPALLAILVNPAGLQPGIYQGAITLTGAGNPPSTATVNVTLTVTAPALVKFTASPAGLYLGYTLGGAMPAPAQVRIVSSPSGAGLSASSSAPWLLVTPAAGNTTTYLTISIEPGILTAGTHLANVVIIGNTGGQLTVPVSVKVAAQADFNLKPKTLSFSYTIGDSSPAGQSITIASTSAQFNWTGSTNAPWLRHSATSGATPASVVVTADPSGLSAGVYNGAVTLSAPSTLSGTVVVPVALTVVGAANATPAVFYVSPSGLYLNYTVGGVAPAPVAVRITADKAGATFTAGTAAAWLQVTPGGGTVTASITITALPELLAPGTYLADVVVTGTGGGTRVLPVSLKVSAKPTITVNPKLMAFSATAGTMPAGKSLSIGTTSVAFNYVLSVNAPWLKLSTTTGVAWGSTVVSVDTAGLAPSSYSGAVTVTASGTANGALAVPVTLTVLP
ncbi:MAG: right-handed parallel beta-helix repeat-containing protein [Bryobacterales bacterium]|nr:right-handed parallel beta-helix repeat-containing protein [Bryobacterales bacterium]